MGALANPRHEVFCQHRANLKTAAESYALAGYPDHYSNAARLSRNEQIRARVAEIQEKRTAQVEWKVEEAIASMREIVDSARASKFAKDSDRVAAARAAAAWLGWEKQTAVQSAPIIIIKIGGDSPDNRD